MKRSWFLVLMCAFATVTLVAQEPSTTRAETTAAVAAKGRLVSANGARLGTVNRLAADGSPQIIIDGKLVTVPVATLSTVDGKLTTSLSKSEVLALP